MKKISIFISLLWMVFIFYNSSQNGIVSNTRSFSIIESAKAQSGSAEKLVKSTPKTKNDETLNLILRKNAHAFEYLVLGVLLGSTFSVNNFKEKNFLMYILFICLFYAVTDEFHQSFVPGRTSLVSDVLIDFLGAVVGAAVYYLKFYKPGTVRFTSSPWRQLFRKPNLGVEKHPKKQKKIQPQ